MSDDAEKKTLKRLMDKMSAETKSLAEKMGDEYKRALIEAARSIPNPPLTKEEIDPAEVRELRSAMSALGIETTALRTIVGVILANMAKDQTDQPAQTWMESFASLCQSGGATEEVRRTINDIVRKGAR